MKDILNYSYSIKKYEIKRQTIENTSFLIVPVVLIKEGILNGSQGPIFYSAEAIQTFHHTWNKAPVSIGHPETGVCKQEELEKCIGYLWNVRYDNKEKALKGEIWFNENKLKNKDFKLYSKVMNGEPVEVSTGLTSPVENIEGTFNGASYIGKATILLPDHLAVLPNEQGACSLNDGCGIRNKKNLDENPDGSVESNTRKNTASTLTNGENEMDPKKKTCGCPDKITALINSKVFSDEHKQLLESIDNSVLDIILENNKAKEKAEKELETVQNSLKQKEDDLSSKEKELASKEEEIKNASSKNDSDVTFEALLNSAPAEIKESIETGLAMNKKAKTALIERITKHEGSQLSKSLLENKNLGELEAIASLLPKEKAVTFEGRVVGNASATTKVEALSVPSYNEQK